MRLEITQVDLKAQQGILTGKQLKRVLNRTECLKIVEAGLKQEKKDDGFQVIEEVAQEF